MHPQHKNSSHQGETIVERCFRKFPAKALAHPNPLSTLERRKGVLKITCEPDRGLVRVRYDVRHTRFSEVRRLLEQATHASSGLWQRWRSGWLDNRDINLRDNATHRPACCSGPPPGASGAP